MTEEQVLEQLNTLRSIVPSPDYARVSRTVILAYPKREIRHGFFGAILTQSMQFGFSIGLVALFLILALSNVTSIFHPLSEPNLAGIDTNTLSSEAENVNESIDVYIEEAAYFDNIAEKTSVALNEASVNGPDHANPLLIENEIKNIDTGVERSSENIDALLEQVML